MIELSKGQELALTTEAGLPLSRLQVGLGWDKLPTAGAMGTGAPDVDLDASAIQFAGTQFFDMAFYNNLATRDGSLTHLGDNQTGKGTGDDEVLSLDLSKVYERVDTIVVLVSSYHSHSLEWIDNAYCRVHDSEAPEVGTAELARFTLTSGVPETGLVMARFVRDGDHWTLRAIGEGIAVKVPTEAVDKLGRYL